LAGATKLTVDAWSRCRKQGKQNALCVVPRLFFRLTGVSYLLSLVCLSLQDANVVDSLDIAMMGYVPEWHLPTGLVLTLLCSYMKQWFPKEVKEKKKENGLEVAKEEAGEMGVDARCVIM
jgi:hypothetical protein